MFNVAETFQMVFIMLVGIGMSVGMFMIMMAAMMESDKLL
tara:strand:- start:699 stop:818 length:120 start_codon:yes stop_codon:yes gene_type:complete